MYALVAGSLVYNCLKTLILSILSTEINIDHPAVVVYVTSSCVLRQTVLRRPNGVGPIICGVEARCQHVSTISWGRRCGVGWVYRWVNPPMIVALL